MSIVTSDTNRPRWAVSEMIVCSCNVITDHDVRGTLASSEAPPRSTGDVYRCLGCSVQCGRCARTIRRIMNEALAATDGGCCRANGGS